MTISINYDDHSNEELARWLEVRDRDLASANGRCERLEADLRELGRALVDAQHLAANRQTELESFKQQVRTRMIEEAERRGWCTEFDDILEEFGLERRTGTYEVQFAVTGRIEMSLLARDEEHAEHLARNALRFREGTHYDVNGQTVYVEDITCDSCERQ